MVSVRHLEWIKVHGGPSDPDNPWRGGFTRPSGTDGYSSERGVFRVAGTLDGEPPTKDGSNWEPLSREDFELRIAAGTPMNLRGWPKTSHIDPRLPKLGTFSFIRSNGYGMEESSHQDAVQRRHDRQAAGQVILALQKGLIPPEDVYDEEVLEHVTKMMKAHSAADQERFSKQLEAHKAKAAAKRVVDSEAGDDAPQKQRQKKAKVPPPSTTHAPAPEALPATVLYTPRDL